MGWGSERFDGVVMEKTLHLLLRDSPRSTELHRLDATGMDEFVEQRARDRQELGRFANGVGKFLIHSNLARM